MCLRVRICLARIWVRICVAGQDLYEGQDMFSPDLGRDMRRGSGFALGSGYV